MQRFLRRSLSGLLLTAILFSILSCASSPIAPDDTAHVPSTDPGTPAQDDPGYEDARAGAKDRLPDSLDLGGEPIVILSRDDDFGATASSKELGRSMYEDELFVEDLNNDVLNDAIYNRTIAVEERLGCELRFVQTGETTETASQLLEKSLNSGDNEYQIYANSAVSVVSQSQKGWFYDLYGLSYLDFDQPWWYDGFREEVEILGRLYCADGSLSLSTLRSACAFFFNKRLAADYNIPDLYEMVDSGKWTIDRLAELTSGIYRDLNGNSERDEEDLYGLVPTLTDAFLCAFEIRFLSKDADGRFYFDCNYDRLTSAYEKVTDLYWNNPGTYSENTASSTKVPMIRFAGGSTLFLSAMLYFAEDGETLRNMQDEYGILPVPKFDEEQKTYHSNPYETATVFAIPVTNPDPDSAAAVLEALNAETYRRVITAYSDVALKGKYLNDPQSRKMFDRIIDGMTVSRGQMYSGQIMHLPQSIWRYMIDGNSGDKFASTYASNERKLPRVVELLNETYEQLDT